jgi:hypothetical protein
MRSCVQEVQAWRQWPVPESDVGFRPGRPTNLPCTSPNGATALVARLRLLERRPSRYALWKIIAPVSQCYYYILGVRWGACFQKINTITNPPIFTIFWLCLCLTSRLRRIRAAYRCHPSFPIPLALLIARYLPLPDTRHSQLLLAPHHPRIGARSFRVLCCSRCKSVCNNNVVLPSTVRHSQLMQSPSQISLIEPNITP